MGKYKKHIKRYRTGDGFDMRIKGSHHVFRREGISVRINLQQDGNKAKPYQVKQVRSVILEYNLSEEINNDE